MAIKESLLYGQPLIEINDFTGGFNSNSGGVVGQSGFNPNQASYLNNAYIVKEGQAGSVGKLPGNETKLTFANPVYGLYEAKFKTGYTRLLAVTGSSTVTNIHSINTGTWVATTLATTATLAASQELADFEMMNNTCIITMKNNVPLKVTQSSTSATKLTGWPPSGVTGNPAQVEQHKGSLFLTNNDTTPDEMYYSDKGSISTWNAKVAGPGWFGIPNGSIIKAAKSFYGDIMSIFTNRELWFLNGDAPPDSTVAGEVGYSLYIAYSGVKFNSPMGIVNTDQGMFFWNNNDLMLLKPSQTFGDIDQNVISRVISPTLNDLTISYSKNIFGYYLGDDYRQIWWFIPTGTNTTNSDLLIYDVDTKSFFYARNRTASCIVKLDDNTVLTGHADGTVKQELTGYTYNGAAIDFDWTSGWFDLNDYMYLQKIEIVHYQNGNFPLTIKIYKDWNDNDAVLTEEIYPTKQIYTWNDTNTTWGTATFNAPYIARSRLIQLGACKAIKIKVVNENDGENVQLVNVRIFGGIK